MGSGFLTLLKKLAEYWDKDRDGVAAQAANLTGAVAGRLGALPDHGVGEAELDLAVTQFAEDF
ncbi:MAG: hypothetical protein MRJ92_10400 [Nitrospira sp.]|nr:hypothetical protein [Nitrospira sp.]